jgi:hypothetical protein
MLIIFANTDSALVKFAEYILTFRVISMFVVVGTFHADNIGIVM